MHSGSITANMNNSENGHASGIVNDKPKKRENLEGYAAYNYVISKLENLHLGFEALKTTVAPGRVFIYGNGFGILLLPTLAYTETDEGCDLRIIRMPSRVAGFGLRSIKAHDGGNRILWDEVYTRKKEIPKDLIDEAKGAADQIANNAGQFRSEQKGRSLDLTSRPPTSGNFI